MHHETLTYQADGLTMRSQLFFEEGTGKRAGVLVFPEAFGISEHAISRAERLAKLGYVALACDLHGDGKLIDELQPAIAALEPLFADPSRTRARARGGLEALTARAEVDAARVAAIGFCFGGTMALELARSGAQIAAVVGFHSGLATAAPKVGCGCDQGPGARVHRRRRPDDPGRSAGWVRGGDAGREGRLADASLWQHGA